MTWLSKRLGTPVRPPRLGKLGYASSAGAGKKELATAAVAVHDQRERTS